jgi:hypothetical protein
MRIISDMDLLAFNFGLEPPLCQSKREVATLQLCPYALHPFHAEQRPIAS